MNANQIINMIVKIVMRKLLHRGVDAGINRIAGGGKSRDEMTPEERQRAQAGRKTARRARQSAKIMRKIGRM